uniref:TPT domain-containing protein n=1 Tax=Panagrellus redivivus TaxID=6233 RepID=A0A7E4VTK1_PANRE
MFRRRMHIDELRKDSNRSKIPSNTVIEGLNSYFADLNLFKLFNIFDKIPLLLILASWLTYFIDSYELQTSMLLRTWFVNSNAIFVPSNHVPCQHVTDDGSIFPSLMRMCYFHGFPTITLRAAAFSTFIGRLLLVSCVTAKWRFKKPGDDYVYRILNPILVILTLVEMFSLGVLLTSMGHQDSIALNKLSGIAFVLSAQLNMFILTIVVTRLEAIPDKYTISNIVQGFFIVFGISAPLSLLFYFDFQNARPCMVTVPAYVFLLEISVHIGYVGFYQALKYLLKDVSLPIFGTIDEVRPTPADPYYQPRVLFGEKQRNRC